MHDNELENKTSFEAEWTAAAARLPRVHAPQYFAAGVRSRIETGKTSGNSGSLAFLKLAMPVAALGALALFFIFSGYLSNDIEPIAVVTETQNSGVDQEAKIDHIASSETQVPTVVKSVEPTAQRSTAAATQPNETDPKTRDEVVAGQPTNNGGSVDLAVNGAKPGVMPKGLNPNPLQEVTGRGLDPQTSVLIVDVLRFTGIQGEIGPRGMVVSSVNENSPAQRAGLHAGDTIEAINDTPLTATATLRGGTALRTIRVNRDGKALRLSF